MNNARRAWMGWLRVALVLSCFLAAGALWSARAVYAEAREGARALGQRLLSELGPHLIGSAQRVEINGQPLFLGTQQSPLSVAEVLDRFSAHCVGGEAAAPDLLRAALAGERRGVQALLDDPLRFGVLRSETDGEGMLACFHTRARDRSLSALIARLARLEETSDLSALGDLRYVTARRDGSGKTQVLAVWAEGPLRLGALFPEQGDAPGGDLAGVPRPPAATRTLTATTPGRGFALRAYESPLPGEELTAFYDTQLAQAGWQALALPDEAAPLAREVRVFTRAGRALAVAVDVQDVTRGVTLVDLGAVHGGAD